MAVCRQGWLALAGDWDDPHPRCSLKAVSGLTWACRPSAWVGWCSLVPPSKSSMSPGWLARCRMNMVAALSLLRRPYSGPRWSAGRVGLCPPAVLGQFHGGGGHDRQLVGEGGDEWRIGRAPAGPARLSCYMRMIAGKVTMMREAVPIGS